MITSQDFEAVGENFVPDCQDLECLFELLMSENCNF